MKKTFNEMINSVLENEMELNPKVVLIGLGVADPKRIFDTTKGLLEKYGDSRIIEAPASENGYLGHAFGLSLGGYCPVVHFQRMDFLFYAFDQLINNISKWESMFGKEISSPLVIRVIAGMGWGQGAQHSQNIAGMLSRIPGLEVVVPSCPNSAAALLSWSLRSKKRVVFIEHRWLQFLESSQNTIKIKKPRPVIRSRGTVVTIVAWSYAVAEALRFISLYPSLSAEVIDLQSLTPIDLKPILNSLIKTKHLIVWEPCSEEEGISGKIIPKLINQCTFQYLHLGLKFGHAPSSWELAKNHYLSLAKIKKKISLFLHLDLIAATKTTWPKDKDLSSWTPWS